MRKTGNWREYLIERFAKDRGEAIGYLQVVIDDYYLYHGNMAIFLYALDTVIQSQGGIGKVAEKMQLEPKTLANLLSSDEAPPLDMLGPLLKTLGCRLTIEPLAAATSEQEQASETEAAREENVA